MILKKVWELTERLRERSKNKCSRLEFSFDGSTLRGIPVREVHYIAVVLGLDVYPACVKYLGYTVIWSETRLE